MSRLQIAALAFALAGLLCGCRRGADGEAAAGMTKWSELGVDPAGFCSSDEIILFGRQSNSGTYDFFREVVLQNRDYRLGTRELHGSKDVVEAVGGTPCAIGYSGMGYKTESVKFLDLAEKEGAPATEPTNENVLSGKYPLARPLHMYTIGEPKGAAREYLRWIYSPEAQKIVEAEGYVPVSEELRKKELELLEGTGEAASASAAKMQIQNTGSDTMVNLAQSWAEAYKKVRPEISVEVAGGGSGHGITDLIGGLVDIANASRDLKDSEAKQVERNTGKKPREFVVAYDGIGIYVNKDNPLEEITIPQLAEIYGSGE